MSLQKTPSKMTQSKVSLKREDSVVDSSSPRINPLMQELKFEIPLESESHIDFELKDEDDEIEPLLDPKNERTQLFPIPKLNKAFWDFYNKAKASFWVPEEIDFAQDIKDWEGHSDNPLSAGEKTFMEMMFAFFSVFDQIVIENLENDFTNQIKIREVAMFYRFQAVMEDIHIHTYSLFPEKFIKDIKRREWILNAVENIPVIGKMAAWAKTWMTKSWTHRLVAFIMVEGLMFSGAFASIFYMKKQGKLPGLAHANELIARDEGYHRDFGILIYTLLKYKLPIEDIIKMVTEATDLAVELCVEAIPVKLIGMNSELMAQYIKSIADGLCGELTGGNIYGDKSPFPWMDLINLEGKTNFFDARVSQYARQAVLTDAKDNVIEDDPAWSVE